MIIIDIFTQSGYAVRCNEGKNDEFHLKHRAFDSRGPNRFDLVVGGEDSVPQLHVPWLPTRYLK